MTRLTRRFALLLTVLLVLAGCGRQDAQTPPTATPSPTDPTPANGDGEPEETMEVTAWFARFAGQRQWVEPETHELPESEGVARAALELMVSGQPRHPELETLAPAGTRVLDVQIADRVLTVDLSEGVRSEGRASMQEVAFAHQLAHTGAQFPTVDAVVLWVEGEPIEDLWGHLDWSQPLEPDPMALTPVTIESPRWGEDVESGRITASGQANTFEATVVLRLIGPDGSVVEDTFTTATSGSGERGTWAHTFDTPVDEPGTWAIEAEEPDPSGGAEGFPPVLVRTEFAVQ